MAKPKMILVVDDDPNLLMFFKEYFKEEGYDAVLTEDPEKAIRTAEVMHPDLLIIDIRMPKIDGFGVLKKIREKTPAIQTIVMSSVVSDMKDRIEEAKVQAVLTKPIKFEELEEWILKLLNVTKAEIQDKQAASGDEKISILFVDDETEILAAVAETFNEYGYAMETAKSGEDGLERIKSKQYDILITDSSMGKMAGYDLVKAINGLESNKPYVTMVASANLAEELRSRYRELGVGHFMEKPLRFDEMMDWLESQIPEVQKKRSGS